MNQQGVFLYFVPDIKEEQITRDWLKSQPFAADFRDLWQTALAFAAVGNGGVVHGPEGQSGRIIFAAGNSSQPFGYHPDRQEWRKFDGFWMGFDKEHRPGPDSLKRRHLFEGYEIELLDGQVWIAPVIRAWHEHGIHSCTLPLVWGLDDDSPKSRLSVQEAYKPFWDLSGESVDFYFGRTQNSKADRHDAATTYLALNYRISRAGIEFLELLDTVLDEEVWRAAIDAKLVDEWLERKRDESVAHPT